MNPKKRQALEKILEALIPYWDMAEGFLLLLQEGGNDELIEQLYNEIKSEIKKINGEKNRKNIKNILKKIRNKEKNEKEKDDKYIEDLINSI